MGEIDRRDAQERETSADWKADCLRWRGRVLTGKFGHWCADWDGLPIDETTPEWPYCACYSGARLTEESEVF